VDFENAPMELDFSPTTLICTILFTIFAIVVIAKGRD
jgi:hypothetical protein